MDRSIGLLLRLAEREGVGARDRYFALTAALRQHQRALHTYARQAARIGEMEAVLVDAKIAARILGLLESDPRSGNWIGIMEDHLAAVLRPSPFATVLEQTVAELKQEIGQRGLTAQAKAMLQRTKGISEEEAHLQLRAMSRKSRKPLGEVARELVEAENSLWLHRL